MRHLDDDGDTPETETEPTENVHSSDWGNDDEDTTYRGTDDDDSSW